MLVFPEQLSALPSALAQTPAPQKRRVSRRAVGLKTSDVSDVILGAQTSSQPLDLAPWQPSTGTIDSSNEAVATAFHCNSLAHQTKSNKKHRFKLFEGSCLNSFSRELPRVYKSWVLAGTACKNCAFQGLTLGRIHRCDTLPRRKHLEIASSQISLSCRLHPTTFLEGEKT